MGMDIGGGFGAGGAVQGLQQLLAQRFAERQQAERERATLVDEATKQQQLQEQMQWRQMQQKELERSHQENETIRRGQEANALGDQIPANAFLAKTDPAVGILQTGGRGALLNEQPERPQVAEGPLQPGDTGEARPPGYLKLPSAKQQQPEKPTAEQDQRRYLDIQQKQQLRQPVTPEEAAYAKAYERTKTLVPTANFNLNQPQRDDARSDRSYNARAAELKDLRKPLADQADKLTSLNEMLDQNTPQADALVAPKLLSALVGGAGSGLRMNEAEISRVLGGRSVWESLKAAAQKWSTDPTAASSITPEQRKQIRNLAAAYQTHVGDRLKMVDDANDQLIDAGDVNAHRRIVSDLRTRLDARPAGQTTTDEGFVYARDPQGGLHKAKRGTALPAGWKEEQH